MDQPAHKQLTVLEDTYNNLTFLKECYGSSINRVVREALLKCFGELSELSDKRKAEIKAESFPFKRLKRAKTKRKQWHITVAYDVYEKLEYLKYCFGTTFDGVIRYALLVAYGEFTEDRKADLVQEIHQERMKRFLDALQ